MANRNFNYRDDQQRSISSHSRFEWEKLPLEVYESLVKYFDASSLMNMCLSSDYVASRVLEPFSVLSCQKREVHWHKFCIKYLDRSLVCKIFLSWDLLARNRGSVDEEVNESVRCMVSWESVFYAYTNYWKLLTTGHAQTLRLNKFENKLKAEMLCVTEAESVDSTRGLFNDSMALDCSKTFSWIIRSGGGEIISSIMLPCPSNANFNRINLVVAEASAENANCIHLSSLCSKATEFFGVRTVHFPIIRNGNGKKVLDVDRVLLSACNDCVTSTPLLGGVTRKMSWPEERMEDGTLDDVEGCLVFEVKENVIVMWPRPRTLVFFLMIASPDQEGFDFKLLYTLRFANMNALWYQAVRFPAHYLAVIDEFPGSTPTMSHENTEMVMGKSGYFYHPSNPVYYGLKLISPIHGVQSFKPSTDADEVIVDVFEPKYIQENVEKYLPSMQDPKCSGKGYGKYVFCSNTTIGVSWNAVDWLFGPLTFPTTCVSNAGNAVVTHVEVIHYNGGLLLVVNEDIILAEMIVRNAAIGPEVAIKPLRVFQTTLASLCKQISHIELSFDNGLPFFLVVAKQQKQCSPGKDKDVLKRIRHEFSFSVLRINFDDDF